MKPVDIYTIQGCWFCDRAKSLLAARGVRFTEHRVDGDQAQRARLLRVTGQRTVPQIFIGEDSIGGCSDLETLIRLGKLDPLLADAEEPLINDIDDL
ncbi:glutaredoxin 3 [Myxococcota bacterium]|nr:glutaredoxin 3 [Myxococcota bacterium]MBU1430892.1 glutaredoxin 3 [Myxococcota bacterium]MBU1899199.1 glutaredoxin 3 [Myxococcota bacterium]